RAPGTPTRATRSARARTTRASSCATTRRSHARSRTRCASPSACRRWLQRWPPRPRPRPDPRASSMGEPSLRERALRHLARRDHSRAELARKLAAHGDADEIDAVIERMGELGLQSDTRYAEAFVRGKAGRFGASRLRSELARRGVDRDLIDEAI